MGDVAVAFGLTLFAGLATGVGSALALFSKRENPRFLAASLGFSAGVMIYVAMVEMLDLARESLEAGLGKGPGAWAATGAFFGGIVFIGVIDRLVPTAVNPHEMPHDDEESVRQARLLRTGLFTALALAIHNFPEGFATFVTALEDPRIALPVAVAIAVHNIPEGIAVSVPIHYATGSRRRAFVYSFASGLAEPAGAILGYLALRPFIDDTVMGVVLAGVAGVMVFVSIDELLPSAHEFGEHHLAVYGLIAGMAVMALTLLMLQ